MDAITSNIQELLSTNPTLTRFIIGMIVLLAALNIGVPNMEGEGYFFNRFHYRRKNFLLYILGLLVLGGVILYFIKHPDQMSVWFIRLINFIEMITDWIVNFIQKLLKRT